MAEEDNLSSMCQFSICEFKRYYHKIAPKGVWLLLPINFSTFSPLNHSNCIRTTWLQLCIQQKAISFFHLPPHIHILIYSYISSPSNTYSQTARDPLVDIWSYFLVWCRRPESFPVCHQTGTGDVCSRTV